MSYVQEILLVTAFCFAVITLIAGLIMLIIPGKIYSLTKRTDIYISTESFFSALDKTKNLERFFYKHHLGFGIFVILGAVYTVYILTTSKIPYRVLPEIISPVISTWLYDALLLVLLIFNGLAILIGLIVLFRPSELKNFEAKMNKWVDSSGIVQQLDAQRLLEQQKPLKWPRVYGLIVFAGSAYILWETAPYVLL